MKRSPEARDPRSSFIYYLEFDFSNHNTGLSEDSWSERSAEGQPEEHPHAYSQGAV